MSKQLTGQGDITVNNNSNLSPLNNSREEIYKRIKDRLNRTNKLFSTSSDKTDFLFHPSPISLSVKSSLYNTTIIPNNDSSKLKERFKEEEEGTIKEKKRKERTFTEIELYKQEDNFTFSEKVSEEQRQTQLAYTNSHFNVENSRDETTKAIILQEKRRRKELEQKPQWHAPWKIMRVISSHNGWVRCISVDTSNEWFATGSNDCNIKIFDLASGHLKLTLTGHAAVVRDLSISERSPYLFSVGEDKSVKCWDLESNECIRNYHGHLSGVYCCALHPSLDLLATGGRDSSCRIWDIRTRREVFLLTGHDGAVASVLAQSNDPQIITGSMDSTIRCWDLRMGKTITTLTNHKKSVRALALHPNEYTFASASTDSIRKWKCPEAKYLLSFKGNDDNTIINSMCINNDGVMACSGNDGSLFFWDWKTGHHFQTTHTIPQPGSLDSEASIFCCIFDRSGSRLITAEADKSIKIWKEDEKAIPIEEENQKSYISHLFEKKRY
ncbi:hypothetical protein ABK040_007194 [Willaertia magna]